MTIEQEDGTQRIIGTLGNVSSVTGKSKAGKTFGVSAAVAAAVACRLILKIKGSLPAGQRTVLLFDTEQSRYHVLRVVRRICALSGIAEPPNLIVFSLREYPPNERLALIDYAFNNTPGVGLVVIDGIRDLQVDPVLDSEQSSKIITHLLRWTTDLNIHILTVLHQNKTDNNSRGHLGTELNHKAETVISITKDSNDKEVSVVAPEYCRDRDFEPFAFSINEQGLPFLVEGWKADQRSTNRKEAKTAEASKASRTVTPGQLPAETHTVILQRAFSGVTPDKYGETCRRIKAAAEYFGHKFGDNRAKEFVTYYLTNHRLKLVDTTYTLNLPPVELTVTNPIESGLV
ncbi:AAA family ATPase [Spirosoma endophyticum]|uniref:AAA family ATPase n=1 Tax=Spirosoma endophyticum TaxID=662367 RepID=UPI000B11EC3F|nr:AAA family ATPase [Spirosoma endophyticum]